MNSVELFATIIFVLAVIHTFSVKIFQKWAARFAEGSVGENVFHLLGEVEIIFGLWSLILFLGFCILESVGSAIEYVESRTFTEPLFIFAIMVVASTKPIIDFASLIITMIAKKIPRVRPAVSFFMTCSILGPLLGSLITEPAAMTVTVMIMANAFFSQKLSKNLKYAILGLLFVNISIGGVLTHFGAPPVVMVAKGWGWDTPWMFFHFGWKAILGVFLSSLSVVLIFRKEFKVLKPKPMIKKQSPLIMSFFHLLFLVGIIITSHHEKLFISILLFFIGFATVTKEYQDSLKIKEGLLVGFFLGGLVTLGGMQSWWVKDLVHQLSSGALFLGATALTAIFDNAALTYLGSLVSGISEASKYALVSGSVVGGGLTVIANAPNPIGYGLLNSYFGNEGIDPLQLARWALLPTVIAGSCFYFL